MTSAAPKNPSALQTTHRDRTRYKMFFIRECEKLNDHLTENANATRVDLCDAAEIYTRAKEYQYIWDVNYGHEHPFAAHFALADQNQRRPKVGTFQDYLTLLKSQPWQQRLCEMYFAHAPSKLRIAACIILQHMLEIFEPGSAAPTKMFIIALEKNMVRWFFHPRRFHPRDQSEDCDIYNRAIDLAHQMISREGLEIVNPAVDLREAWIRDPLQFHPSVDRIVTQQVITTDDSTDEEDKASDCSICRKDMRTMLQAFLPEFLPMLPLKDGFPLESDIKQYNSELERLELKLVSAVDSLTKEMAKDELDDLNSDFCQRISREWIDPVKRESLLKAPEANGRNFKKKISITKCNHRFCQECLRTWLLQRRESGYRANCPMCREILDDDVVRLRSGHVHLPYRHLPPTLISDYMNGAMPAEYDTSEDYAIDGVYDEDEDEDDADEEEEKVEEEEEEEEDYVESGDEDSVENVAEDLDGEPSTQVGPAALGRGRRSSSTEARASTTVTSFYNFRGNRVSLNHEEIAMRAARAMTRPRVFGRAASPYSMPDGDVAVLPRRTNRAEEQRREPRMATVERTETSDPLPRMARPSPEIMPIPWPLMLSGHNPAQTIASFARQSRHTLSYLPPGIPPLGIPPARSPFDNNIGASSQFSNVRAPTTMSGHSVFGMDGIGMDGRPLRTPQFDDRYGRTPPGIPSARSPFHNNIGASSESSNLHAPTAISGQSVLDMDGKPLRTPQFRPPRMSNSSPNLHPPIGAERENIRARNFPMAHFAQMATAFVQRQEDRLTHSGNNLRVNGGRGSADPVEIHRSVTPTAPSYGNIADDELPATSYVGITNDENRPPTMFNDSNGLLIVPNNSIAHTELRLPSVDSIAHDRPNGQRLVQFGSINFPVPRHRPFYDPVRNVWRDQ